MKSATVLWISVGEDVTEKWNFPRSYLPEAVSELLRRLIWAILFPFQVGKIRQRTIQISGHLFLPTLCCHSHIVDFGKHSSKDGLCGIYSSFWCMVFAAQQYCATVLLISVYQDVQRTTFPLQVSTLRGNKRESCGPFIWAEITGNQFSTTPLQGMIQLGPLGPTVAGTFSKTFRFNL